MVRKTQLFKISLKIIFFFFVGNSVMNRGPSPGIDNVSLLNDYVGMPSSTSPIGTISSMNDDIGMGMGNSLGVPGRTKATPMQIRCKFGSLGASKAQFNSPHGFCLGVEEEIIVADTNNHRIEVCVQVKSIGVLCFFFNFFLF